MITEAGSLIVKNVDEKTNIIKSVKDVREKNGITESSNDKATAKSNNKVQGGNSYKLAYSTLLAKSHVA